MCLHTRKSLYTGASQWHIAWAAYNADRSRITCRREITCSDFTVRASACVTLHEVSYIMFYLAVYTVTHERSTCAGKVANFSMSLSLLGICIPCRLDIRFSSKTRIGYTRIFGYSKPRRKTSRRVTYLRYGTDRYHNVVTVRLLLIFRSYFLTPCMTIAWYRPESRLQPHRKPCYNHLLFLGKYKVRKSRENTFPAVYILINIIVLACLARQFYWEDFIAIFISYELFHTLRIY